MLKKLSIVLFLFVSISTVIPLKGNDVISWVPPYGIAKCYTNLTDSSQTFWVKDALTHLGLQFWVPGDNGKIEYVSKYKYTYLGDMSNDIKKFVDWGKANDVKMLLCLFNTNAGDFDWAIAQKAFLTHPDSTIKNIMTQVDLHNLDGVDIDFEGVGSYDSDKNAYASFLSKLNTALKAKGKYLSCDIFPTPCFNYPNPSWEAAIAPFVDNINVMGYTDLYEASTTTYGWCAVSSETGKTVFKYSYVADYATGNQGISSDKISFGVPGWVATWGGQGIQEHIYDMKNAATNAGIAIWDLQLSGNGQWKEEKTWELLAQFKSSTLSVQKTKKVVDLMQMINSSEYRVLANDVQIELLDVKGNLVKIWRGNKGEIMILPALSSGIYLLKGSTKTHLQVIKYLSAR